MTNILGVPKSLLNNEMFNHHKIKRLLKSIIPLTAHYVIFKLKPATAWYKSAQNSRSQKKNFFYTKSFIL